MNIKPKGTSKQVTYMQEQAVGHGPVAMPESARSARVVKLTITLRIMTNTTTNNTNI